MRGGAGAGAAKELGFCDKQRKTTRQQQPALLTVRVLFLCQETPLIDGPLALLPLLKVERVRVKIHASYVHDESGDGL